MKVVENFKNVIVLVLVTLCFYLCYMCLTAVNKIQDRLDRDSVEFQFVVTDSVMSVYDGDEYVGTVKIQGQLDSLLVDYFE